MAHPMLKSSQEGHNAKLRRFTEDYGSASGPANNILAPTNREKREGPEPAIGFGSESGTPRPRADRASRLSNPIPTYANGGAAKRAAGGRAKKKGATNVNVIVAPQGGGAPPPMPPPAPILGGPPPGAPPMPPKPPMGAGPMGMPPGAAGLPMAPGAPGGLPPGIVPPRAGGGRVHKDEEEDKALIAKTLKNNGLVRASGGRIESDEPQGDDRTARTLKNEGLTRSDQPVKYGVVGRASGGRMPHHHMTAGAGTGIGRLEKIGEKPKNAGRPQAV